MVKLGKYFADFNFAVHDLPRNTAKIGRRENFPFYGIHNSMLKKFVFFNLFIHFIGESRSLFGKPVAQTARQTRGSG